MINFDYDKVIIVKYLTGGGGTFLLSCLGLSDDAVLKQKDLSQMQLDGKLPIEKKLKYLLLATKQQFEKKIWSDWGFRNITEPFWFVEDNDYSLYGKEDISRKFAPIVSKCIDNNKFMFLGVHDDILLISILNCWKNSKVIIFKNEQKFASTRALGNHLNISSSSSITKLQLDQSRINNSSYEWDCDWYFSKDKTISEIKKLYDSFGLSGFNAEMISEFYEAWINAIKL